MLKLDENTRFSEIWEAEEFREFRDYFIVNMDLLNDPNFGRTLGEIDTDSWSMKGLIKGLLRLQEMIRRGHHMIPISTEEERAKDPLFEKTGFLYFPSDDPAADTKPYIMVVPGGAYTNVWNLTEGYPVAAHFNELGYHAFIMSYRVNNVNAKIFPEGGLMPRPLDDLAQAFKIIRERKAEFRVDPDKYLITGFSAGGSLVSLWCDTRHGYPCYGIPKPQAVFPVYPVVSWRQLAAVRNYDGFSMATIGLTLKEAAESDWNAEDNVQGFPPAYIVLTADDDLVPPEQSKILARALDAAGIPNVLEIGEKGGHGFAEGWKADTCGWIERAAAFAEKA